MFITSYPADDVTRRDQSLEKRGDYRGIITIGRSILFMGQRNPAPPFFGWLKPSK